MSFGSVVDDVVHPAHSQTTGTNRTRSPSSRLLHIPGRGCSCPKAPKALRYLRLHPGRPAERSDGLVDFWTDSVRLLVRSWGNGLARWKTKAAHRCSCNSVDIEGQTRCSSVGQD